MKVLQNNFESYVHYINLGEGLMPKYHDVLKRKVFNAYTAILLFIFHVNINVNVNMFIRNLKTPVEQKHCLSIVDYFYVCLCNKIYFKKALYVFRSIYCL